MTDAPGTTSPDRSDAEILATVSPSAPRRMVGVTTLALLGGLLVYLVLSNPPASVLAIVLLMTGGLGALAGSEALRRATAHRLELTAQELRDSAGRRLALVEEIEQVDRGMMAFKPSNGFLLRLATPGPRHWAPGLWWRLGRRVGVGGVTAASETKAMAEALAFLLAARKDPGP